MKDTLTPGPHLAFQEGPVFAPLSLEETSSPFLSSEATLLSRTTSLGVRLLESMRILCPVRTGCILPEDHRQQ